MSKENREKQFKKQKEREFKGGPKCDPLLVAEFGKVPVIVPKKPAVKK